MAAAARRNVGEDLAAAADTLVVLMAFGELSEVAAVLARAVGGSRPAAVIGKTSTIRLTR